MSEVGGKIARPCHIFFIAFILALAFVTCGSIDPIIVMPTVLTADVAGSVQVKGRQVSLQLSLPEFGLTRAEPTSTPPCTKAFAQKIQDGSISFHPSRAHTAPSELGRRIYGIQSDLGLMPRGVANSTGSNGAGLCYKESRRRLSFIASNLLHQSCEHLGLELFAKWSGSHWQQSG